jgi:RHS repeat-associated protein
MKTYAALATILTVLAVAPALRAQQCYTPITSWQGNYSLNASGSSSCNGGSCTISQTAASDVNMNSSFASCSSASWSGTDANFTGSLSDTDLMPCVNGGQQTLTLSGTGSGSSSSQLSINVSNGTYFYPPAPVANATYTAVACDGSQHTANTTWPLSPEPGTNWPATFTLPATVEPLVVDRDSFQAGAFFPGAVVPWTFSFTLDPVYNTDDDCKKDGGSSIGCQNQSLGEDVPIVGTEFKLHYEGDRAPGAGGNSAAAVDAFMIGGWTLSAHHAYAPGTNTLFLGDGTQRNGYQLGTPVSSNGSNLITSEDGSEVYVFDGSTGRHLQTLRPLTGALKYEFTYDTAGKLVTVTDGTGNVTTIQRNGSEQATAIVSPYGQTTTLSLDSNGFLSDVTDPLGKSATFTYTSTGLLMSRTDVNGNVYSYTYDGQGRLAKDADPIGGYTGLTRTKANSGLGWTVAETTSMGRTSSFQSTITLPWVQNGTSTQAEQRTNTWANGLQATSTKTQQNNQISDSFALPDGTASSDTLGPDPVWGIQVPITTSETLTRGNLTMNISGSRSTTLGTPGNPFTVATRTDTQTINGRTYTSVFTGSSKTYVDSTPVKRKTTTILDSLERISSTQLGALLPIKFGYDTKGRVATITQGTRTTTLTYDSNGFLASTTDPLNRTNSFTRDSDGRPLTATLPDGRVITYTYDANGNVTSVTPPGKSAHDFSYTAVNLTSAYTPPTVSGTGATTYAYNFDRDLTTVTRPDSETITFGYDSAGRLSSTTTPTETVNYAYDATTGNLSTASISGGEAIAYGYNGPLPTSSTWTGTVAGSVSRAYNDNFWVTSETINSGNTINFSYDNDGLLTKAGALAAKYNPNGLLTGATLGNTLDSRGHDTFGELTTYAAKYKVGTTSTTLYSAAYTRDADGRVSAKTETIGGVKSTYAYTYDQSGRLTRVNKNGVTSSSYTYDTNSNRITATTSSGTVTGTYDAQDRLLTYGNNSYAYTANGELASMTVGSQTTSYQYDVLGNLIAAILPNGTKITYIIDPEDNRVGREVNGVLATGFLYDGDSIVAQLNGSNAVVTQFIYSSRSTSPDYMVAGGITYRIVTDHLGSPRLVVNTSTGQIAEEIDYDEFGNVINDTNPGFQPFGFAGGLYDLDTKLVRFGMRDYTPSIGRWTAKDPVSFAGGDTDLYGYVFADPVNLTDPTGLDACKKKRKLKWVVDKIAHGVTGDKVTIGPVNVSIVKPEASVGVSVAVQADGQTVAEATGKVTVGVTTADPNPSKPIFQIDVDGNVKVLGHTVVNVHWHTEGVDNSTTTVTKGFQTDVKTANDICTVNCKD